MMISVSDELMRLLVDRDPCWFDHHGGCQAHGYLSLEPGQICPQQELKTILEKVEANSPEVLTFDAADYGIAWPNTPKGIVEEALREFVGDGEGADGAVFAAFVNEIRASAEAEVEQLRQTLDSEIENCAKRVEESESFEETSRSVANFLSQKISAFQYSRDQARNELTQRELHHFEVEQENEALKAELAEIDERVNGARGIHRRNWVAENEVTRLTEEVTRLEAQVERMQVSLEACPYGTEGHSLCDCAQIERARVQMLENQASNLQMLVEDLESSFETLAVGHERSHSSYIRGTEAANEIRLVLRQVAERQFGEPGE